MNMQFYYCNKCNLFVAKEEKENIPITCSCGEMQRLTANSTEAATEKHLPKVTINKKDVKVEVGEILHPMLELHYINNIVLVTNKGYINFALKPNEQPIVNYTLKRCEKLLEVYSFCNLHGLWVTKL